MPLIVPSPKLCLLLKLTTRDDIQIAHVLQKLGLGLFFNILTKPHLRWLKQMVGRVTQTQEYQEAQNIIDSSSNPEDVVVRRQAILNEIYLQFATKYPPPPIHQ